MLVTKDPDNKFFDYIYPWGETLASIAWAIRASYRCIIISVSVQAVFGRDILFNIASVIYWRVTTSVKQRQVDIDNVRGNSEQVTHDYAIIDQVYVEMTVMYLKLYYKKQGPCRITEVFTNSAFRFQQGKLYKQINIKRLNPHFGE